MKEISIISAVAGGTALSLVVRRANGGADREVVVWARETTAALEINTSHRNEAYLPKIRLNEAVHATNDLAIVVGCARVNRV